MLTRRGCHDNDHWLIRKKRMVKGGGVQLHDVSWCVSRMDWNLIGMDWAWVKALGIAELWEENNWWCSYSLYSLLHLLMFHFINLHWLKLMSPEREGRFGWQWWPGSFPIHGIRRRTAGQTRSSRWNELPVSSTQKGRDFGLHTHTQNRLLDLNNLRVFGSDM